MQNVQTWTVGLALLLTLGASAASWQRVAAHERRLGELQADLDQGIEPRNTDTPWRPAVDELRRDILDLAERIEALSQARRSALDGDAAPGAAGTGAGVVDAGTTAEGSDSDAPGAPADRASQAARERRELADLLESLLGPDGQLSGDAADMARFWELAKGSTAIDDWMGELESQVEVDPQNADLRMDLADAYVAKLYTTSGPEQGRWGGKAEEQWQRAAELDPNHWEANFSLGNNYAYYPDVMNRTKDAIERLERAREIQERTHPHAQHVQTYLFLARLYRRQGKLDEARSVLEVGILRHPDHALLLEALGELDD